MTSLQEEQKKIGELLKKTREAKKKNLADIAATLCIKERFLAALESGNFNNLPGEPYVKGFIRSYSTYLGLNCDQIFIESEKAIHQKEEVEVAKEVKIEVPKKEVSSEKQPVERKKFLDQKELATLLEDDKARPYLWVILTILTLLVVVLMFIPSKNEQLIEKVQTTNENVIENVVETDEVYPDETAENLKIEGPVVEEKIPPVPPKKPEIVENNVAEVVYSGSSVTEVVEQSDEIVELTEQEEVYVPKVYGFTKNPRIVAVAVEKVWIEIRKQLPELEEDIVDENGQPVHKSELLFSKELNTGDKYNVSNVENLYLRTGNAGGINLYLDGNLLKPIGPRGSIRTISLNPRELAEKLEGGE